MNTPTTIKVVRNTISEKNLKREIETHPKTRLWKRWIRRSARRISSVRLKHAGVNLAHTIGLAISEKNLKREIETGARYTYARNRLYRSARRISSVRLKLVSSSPSAIEAKSISEKNLKREIETRPLTLPLAKMPRNARSARRISSVRLKQHNQDSDTYEVYFDQREESQA